MNLVPTVNAPFTEISINKLKTLVDENNSLPRLTNYSFNTPIAKSEIENTYYPLTQLLHQYYQNRSNLRTLTTKLLEQGAPSSPYIIGISGSVAAGKSTTAEALKNLMELWPEKPQIALITTDGFIFPNNVLEAKGLMEKKGFPESYNHKAMVEFLAAIKAGKNGKVPLYDHTIYDIVPDKWVEISQPDILIVEGLGVLQPANVVTGEKIAAPRDYIDFSIYLDASDKSLEQWFLERFRTFRKDALTNKKSFFQNFMHLSDAEADAFALDIWQTINLRNLHENVIPTKYRAHLILTKNERHELAKIMLRNI